MAAEIDSEDCLAGDDVGTVRRELDMADGAYGVRLMLHGDIVDELDDLGEPPCRILAQMHRRGAGMALAPGDGALDPAEALPMGDDADILALGLQDRPLLNMQLEQGFHRLAAHRS